MKKYIITTILTILLFPVNAFSEIYYRYVSVIDSPTAFTIGTGAYHFSVLNYNEGGLELKSFVGINDRFYLGVSIDMEHVVGKQDIQPNSPGVVLKWKFTDGWSDWPISFSIGYDSFYLGEDGKADNNLSSDGESTNFDYNSYNRMIYGPYAVITKPLYAFGGEQHFSIGARLPVQPDYVPVDSTYFLSLDIPLGRYFVLKGEVERIYWNFERKDQWLGNTGLRYNLFDNLGIDVSVRFQADEKPNRIIKMEYSNEF